MYLCMYACMYASKGKDKIIPNEFDENHFQFRR